MNAGKGNYPSQEGNENVGAAAATGSPAGLVSGWLEAAAEEARLLPGEHPECIERTSGDKTGKKYDTTGIRFAWLWDVLIRNVPRGLVCPGRSGEAVVQLEKSFSASMVVSLRIMSPTGSGEVLAETSAVGNHVGRERGDVLRGAETVGLKRCLANWGIGIEAYKGTLESGATSDVRRATEKRRGGTPGTGEMDDRRLLLAVKKRAATLLREEKKDLAAMLLSVTDDAWDFARLNKLQPGDLTPELRQSLQDMLTVMA